VVFHSTEPFASILYLHPGVSRFYWSFCNRYNSLSTQMDLVARILTRSISEYWLSAEPSIVQLVQQWGILSTLQNARAHAMEWYPSAIHKHYRCTSRPNFITPVPL
jgi:hypothetical protein